MKKYLYLLFLLISSFATAQSVTVSGNITDNAGEELIGATVVESGTTNGVVTDFNGNFEITVSSSDVSLQVSYTGYATQEVPLAGNKLVNLILEESAQELGEVVVKGFSGVVGKARKRTESIQRIPESVTALNSEGIENAGIDNITDFAQLVPNLKLSESQAVGVNFLIIRGIPQIRNADAPIAFVIDGVTIPDPSLLNQELFDLALIEAVKGPQGALYGKNAIGGAINIYSKEPTNTRKNSLKLGYGNGNSYLGQFVSSGAIKEDKVFYRFSGQYQNFDGLFTNEFLDRKVDYSQDLTLRGQIIANLSDNFKANLTAQYISSKAGATYYAVNPTGLEAEFLDYLDPNPTDDNNVISQDTYGDSDMKNLFTSLNLEYNFGKAKLQSITSLNDVERNTIGDLDFTPQFILDQGEFNNTTSFNQELRLRNTNTNAKFNWSLGGFVQQVERDFFQSDYFLTDDFAVTDYTVSFNTVALFGFADYKLTDKLTASLGLRYDIDNYEQDDRLGGVVNERDDNVLQPKVSLSYQAAEGALIYANYGRGYRAGGFNPLTTDLYNQDYRKEISDNYELGFKTSSWGNRFIFNGSVFYSDFSDRQQFTYATDFFIPGNYNYAQSEILGFEIDSKTRISKYLDLLVSYGFVDSKIKEGGAVGGESGTVTDLSEFNGNITSFVPRSNFNIGLESGFDLNDNMKMNIGVNLNGTGEIYWTDLNSEDTTSDGYELLDARASLSVKKMKFTLWGRNLLDTQYYLEYDAFGFGWRGVPTTVGATFAIDF